MNFLKRILVMFLVTVMALAFSVTAFAEVGDNDVNFGEIKTEETAPEIGDNDVNFGEIKTDEIKPDIGDNDVNFGDIKDEEITTIIGDATNDGTVDIFDLISLAKSIVTNDYSNVDQTNSDIDQNSTIDIFDLIALAKKIVLQ